MDTAARLFTTHGVHAVGLQQIIDECHCGKNLLYREFASKDDLIVAYLQRCHQSWLCTVKHATESASGNPAGQLVAIVKAVAKQTTAAGARGCPLRNTHAEFPDPDHPAHRVAVEHFASVRAQLLNLARQTGAADPATLADRIMLIVDGLYTNGVVFGNTAAATAIRFAEEVVAAAIQPTADRRATLAN
ncbi:MAG: TetR/AcrR family transcriptional regulator [Pseudonocardiaceae bacterium]